MGRNIVWTLGELQNLPSGHNIFSNTTNHRIPWVVQTLQPNLKLEWKNSWHMCILQRALIYSSLYRGENPPLETIEQQFDIGKLGFYGHLSRLMCLRSTSRHPAQHFLILWTGFLFLTFYFEVISNSKK